MQAEKFIPGFDWFRIVGCILVAATHYGFFRYFYDNYNSLYLILSEGVPVFFIISGYLCGREFSRQRAIKHAVRYGIIYFVLEISIQILYFARLSLQTGEIHLLDFLANVVRCFVLETSKMNLLRQLWFLHALICSLVLNAFMTPRTRRFVLAAVFILRIALAQIGDERITLFYEHILAALPLRWHIIHAEELTKTLGRFLTGFLFTTIGFDIKTWHVKVAHLLLLSLPFAVFEAFVYPLNLTVVFLSIALFFWLKQLQGQFLYPYHTQISLFSVLMYFLHMAEKKIFSFFTDSAILSFLLVILVNLMLTAAVCCLRVKAVKPKIA